MRAVAIAILSVIAATLLLIIGYVAYVALQYYRIPDKLQLEITNNRESAVRTEVEYTVVSYNLGFGAYSPEYTFFMDTGVMNDGTEVVGTYAKGMNKADVQKNVTGQMTVSKQLDADFYFFQEADRPSDRSYNIDMVANAQNAFAEYGSTYAQNFHTARLYYPFNDPIGTIDAGLVTLSRYKMDSAVRRSFPITDAFIDKLFDLDRCFAVHYLPIEGSDKKLTLFDLHMSAYDEGGTIRAKQLEMLNAVLKEERDNGNYVIAGGDFNHCLIADEFETDELAFKHFKSEQQTPDWVKSSVLHKRELTSGYSIAASKEVSTCRGADIPYTEGVNFCTVIDGFIVSDNIKIIDEQTVDTQYAYSDHNPVIMTFALN
ncbi:MAG: endonuclease [Clostridiales bacterium]|nr:endonuclease [Clostridiales bacterium]